MDKIILTPHKNFLEPLKPDNIPGLISFWNFKKSGEEFIAEQGQPYCLHSQSGYLYIVKDAAAGPGGTALQLEEGQWLSLPRNECPDLNIHGKDGHLTLIAWLKRKKTKTRHCEFIAGQWNETNKGRQYGLFINISVWGSEDRVFGHLSRNGGPTPGYRYCMDGAMGANKVPYEEWVMIAMSYDGHAGYAWFNGNFDAYPGTNPYLMPGGLHDSGTYGSDFTVGGVDRSGETGNFFKGYIAGLAVYNRVLTAAEMLALYRCK